MYEVFIELYECGRTLKNINEDRVRIWSVLKQFLSLYGLFVYIPFQFSRFHATHIKMGDSATQVKAMDSVRKAISSALSKNAFPYTRFYVGWETDKVLVLTF